MVRSLGEGIRIFGIGYWVLGGIVKRLIVDWNADNAEMTDLLTCDLTEGEMWSFTEKTLQHGDTEITEKIPAVYRKFHSKLAFFFLCALCPPC